MSLLDKFNDLELIFTSEDAQLYYHNKNTLVTALNQGVNKGYIKRIKRDLYAMINLATGEPYANKFQIASMLSEDAVVSHTSAFQYHGVYNQVSYDMHYTSTSRNKNLVFEENNYIRHSPNINDNTTGVIYDKWSNTRVTDMERTVLDSVYSINKVISHEELIDVLNMLPKVNENRMVFYLEEFKANKTFVQRLGFLLEEFLNFKCSNELMLYLLNKKGNSPKYLLSMEETQKGKTTYIKKWNLVVPSRILRIKGEENELG